jgi:hypothetical protein
MGISNEKEHAEELIVDLAISCEAGLGGQVRMLTSVRMDPGGALLYGGELGALRSPTKAFQAAFFTIR